MAREYQHGSQGRKAASYVLSVAVVLALALVAGLASNTVRLPNTSQTAAQAGSENAKQQTFEGSGPEWAVPVEIYAPQLWPVEVAHITVVVQPLISFQSEDSLYIRPPPLQS